MPCPDDGSQLTYQWCRTNYPDFVSKPFSDATNNNPELENGTRNVRAPRDNWEIEFDRLASKLLSNSALSSKEVSTSLLGYMQSLWPFDGWVIVVANDNQKDSYDKWYTGCRELPLNGSSSKQCRNVITVGAANGQSRVAIGVQVNKRIEHMERVDHKHVMWWASHAEGCVENGSCNSFDGPEEQVLSMYGVAGKDLKLTNPVHRKYAAKLIWQHYRQALDREFLSINSDSCSNWDTVITFCSDSQSPDVNNGLWADIAWEKVNIDDHYHTDYGQFNIGLQDDWYGNNGVAQCITIYVTPFSH